MVALAAIRNGSHFWDKVGRFNSLWTRFTSLPPQGIWGGATPWLMGCTCFLGHD